MVETRGLFDPSYLSDSDSVAIEHDDRTPDSGWTNSFWRQHQHRSSKI